MTKYLKHFDSHALYEAYMSSQNKITPNVCYCEDLDDIHFNSYEDPRFIAIYNVSSTSSATQLIYSSAASRVTDMWIDGEKQTNVTASYTFSTTGNHEVKLQLSSSTGTSTGSNLFTNCLALISVVIPAYITHIETACFSGCNFLANVTLHEGLTNINYSAFQDCWNLRYLTVPSTVTTILNDAFKDCHQSSEWTFLSTTPPTLSNNVFDGYGPYFRIYVPAASVDSYKAATYWSSYESHILPIS